MRIARVMAADAGIVSALDARWLSEKVIKVIGMREAVRDGTGARFCWLGKRQDVGMTGAGA